MPKYVEMSLAQGEDGTFRVSMAPPVSVSGWDVRWTMSRRFGSESPLLRKYSVSGGGGASGITVANGGQGVFDVNYDARDTSGLWGNYAVVMERINSGHMTQLARGYLTVTDAIPGSGG